MSTQEHNSIVHKQVANLYDQLPYPARDPADENKRLVPVPFANWPQINHYCFNGSLSNSPNIRILVAGGGTGDSLIYIAEQLKHSKSEITYIDLSAQALSVAQERAKIRGLNNISWHNCSIENIESLKLQMFDYIDCSGVLHHLPNPQAGLSILCSQLKPEGAIGLMLYGKYGRNGIYQLQDILKEIAPENLAMQERLCITRSLIADLPATNPIRSSMLWEHLKNSDDTELADALLHPQDRAYSVNELYELLSNESLNLITFAGEAGESPSCYKPSLFIKNPKILEIFSTIDTQAQQAISEKISGDIKRHFCYASRKFDTTAKFDSEKIIVPSFPFNMRQVLQAADTQNNEFLNIKTGTGELTVRNDKLTKWFLSYIDGNKSVAQLCNEASNASFGPSRDVLLNSLRELYEACHTLHWMFLRSGG